MPIGMALLEPTRLYVKPVLSLMEKIEIRGMANITGGGFYENIPRIFADKQKYTAVIREGSWDIPPIFARIAAGCYNAGNSGPMAQKLGFELLKKDAALKKQMFNTFNMGIGFVLALSPSDVKAAQEHLDGCGFPSREIGYVEKAVGDNAQGLRIE
jgi:phosphoribosylformylglycinamidine cyclo-ligase